MRVIRPAVVAGVVLLGIGCGRDRSPVSGRVTLDGKPIDGAMVIFTVNQTAGPRPVMSSGARTDADGRFELIAIDKSASGTAHGPRLVQIYKLENGGPDGVEVHKIPGRYGPGRLTLTFDVPVGGTSEANFDLTFDPPAGKRK